MLDLCLYIVILLTLFERRRAQIALMSRDLEKEFINAGVQSPSEFEVASDDLTTNLISHRTVPGVSPKSRVDRIVQTQDSACELKPLGNKCQRTVIVTLENYDHGKQSSQNLNSKGTKKTKKKNKGMDNNTPESGTTRTMSDLERKKLEAELKATEQIAKIKQSVIEKRLELELASLQDDYNPNIRPLQQSPNNELKIFENCLERNENVTEEIHRKPPYRNPLLQPSVSPGLSSPPAQAARSPFQPPFPIPTPPPNQYSRDYPKTKSAKNDSDFLIKNEIKSLNLSPLSTGNYEQRYPRPGNLGKFQRNITLPERGKFMQTVEKPKLTSPPQMEKNPFKFPTEETKYVQAPQISVTETYYANRMPERNANLQQDLQEPGCSPGMANRSNSNSVWKVLMTKMKRKLKKPPPPWQ